MSTPPLWRQLYDTAERAVAPRAENLVRTPGFSLGVAVLRRAQAVSRGSLQGLTARAWHLVNLPAGSDVSRLRAQVGALDREVRRLTVALDSERRRTTGPSSQEDRNGDRARPAGTDRPRPAHGGTHRTQGT
jgi:hypothetical protein